MKKYVIKSCKSDIFLFVVKCDMTLGHDSKNSNKMKEGNSRITVNLKNLSKIVDKGCRIKKLKQDEGTMLKDNLKLKKFKQDT